MEGVQGDRVGDGSRPDRKIERGVKGQRERATGRPRDRKRGRETGRETDRQAERGMGTERQKTDRGRNRKVMGQMGKGGDLVRP